MKRILPYCLILAATTASLAAAQDQVPWAPDYPTACKAAESSNRLVLLHFFSDDCPPCRVVETQVFTQPQVAAAIAKNYVPLKVHARLAPELARRYQVDRWPTDVIVTPGGLEVQRSISPQSPEQYIAFVDAVATTSGTAARRWASNMQQAGQATLTQATATANRYSTEAQQNWGQAAGQFNAAADQAQKNVFQLSQQAQDAARQYGQQTQTAVQGFRQETQNAVQQYQQQAEGAAQFAQQQVNATSQQWQNQITSTGQQLEQQATAARNQFQSAGSQAQDAALQFGAQAQAAAGQFYAGASDLRAPTYPSQSAAPPANVGQFGQPVGQFGQTNSSQPLAAAAAAGVPQPASIQNPYAAQPSPPVGGSQGPLASGPQPPPTSPSLASSTVAPQSAPPGQPGFVPVSEAPPVAIDGYCPVTLLEKTAQNAKDRSAWKRGDPKFGAVHLGRTYLFASEVEQQKFLANPEAYSPVLSGYDPVKYAMGGQLVEGKRSFGITYNRRLFLFADEASRSQFEKAPNAYAQPAYQAMQRSETGTTLR